MRAQCFLAIATFAVVLPVGAQSAPKHPLAILTGELTPADLAAVERGEVIVQDLPTRERRDVAVIGVIHVARPRAEIVRMARATGGAAIGAAHGFRHQVETAETVDDLASLRLSQDDLKGLAKCKQDACNMKLALADMAALRSIVTSETPDAGARAEEYLRRRLADQVASYHRAGNAGLTVYNDRGSVAAGRAFEALVEDSCRLAPAAPELTHFLLDYPRAEVPGESSVIYWALDSLPRTHPTIRIMHEVTYTPAHDAGTTIVASKQLYANHYFEAGLEVLAAADDSVAGGTTVVILRHYRFDQLPHFAFIDLRGRVVDRLKDAVEKDLEKLKEH